MKQAKSKRDQAGTPATLGEIMARRPRDLAENQIRDDLDHLIDLSGLDQAIALADQILVFLVRFSSRHLLFPQG
jgi:hypothetical protein